MIDYIGAVLTSGFKLYDNNFVMSIFSGPSVIQHFHVAHFALGENVLQVKNAFFLLCTVGKPSNEKLSDVKDHPREFVYLFDLKEK